MGKNNKRRGKPVDLKETGFNYAPLPVDEFQEPAENTIKTQAEERAQRARARAEAKETTQNERTPSEEARFVKKLRDTVEQEQNSSWVATRTQQHKASDLASKRAKIETDLRDTQGRYENGSRDWIETDERVERHQLEQDATTWKDFITQKETRKKVEAENKKAAREFVAGIFGNVLAKAHDEERRKTGFSALFENRQTKIITRQQKTAEQNAIATQSSAHRHATADGEQRERSSLFANFSKTPKASINAGKPAPKQSRPGAVTPKPENKGNNAAQVFKRRTEIAATLDESGKKAPQPKPIQSTSRKDPSTTDSDFFVVPKERPETAAKKEEKPAEKGWLSTLTGGWF